MSESRPEVHSMTRLVSSEERESAVQVLTAAFTSDAISVAESERRLADVYGAKDHGDLKEITRDLPTTESREATMPAIRSARRDRTGAPEPTRHAQIQGTPCL